MPDHPDRHSLEALRAFDTPTICNALEIVAPARRTIGFTRRPLIAPFPALRPVVGFARTALIRSREPHPRDRESANRIRASASFAISLDSYKVERPSLMFVKVDDQLKIDAKTLFTR